MGFPKGFPFGRRCQNLFSYWLCGLAEKFKSHLPHETKGSTRKSWSFYFVRKGTLTQQLRCAGSGIHTRLGRTSSSVHPWLALGSKIPRQVLCSKSHLPHWVRFIQRSHWNRPRDFQRSHWNRPRDFPSP